MIYLYGLAETGTSVAKTALDGTMGLQSTVEVSPLGPWALIHSAQDDAEILPRRKLMLAHTRVLERLLPIAPVLPARFGLVAASLDEATDLITSQHDKIASAFDRIRGCVELGVRVSFDRSKALEATLEQKSALRKERDTLSLRGAEARFAVADFGGRLAEQLDRRRGDAQRTLLNALKPLARDHVLRAPDSDAQALRAEFLVDADNQETFTTALQKTAAALPFAPHAEPEIQIIGPAPFYNFVQLYLSPPQEEEAA